MRCYIFSREELAALLRSLYYMAPTDASRAGYLLALNAVALALDLPAVEPELELGAAQPGSPRVQVKARHNHPVVDTSIFAEPPNSPRWREETNDT